MDVIITRPAEDAPAFANLVEQAGGRPILSPVIEIEFAPVRVDLAAAGALAFTSANGVRAFARAHSGRTLPVFAVGETTAAAARGYGFNTVVAADGDVASLAARIAEAGVAGEVVHIAGSDRAGELADLLAAAGVGARREVLYAARPVSALCDQAAAAVRHGGAVATFFSPRSAALFLDQAGKAGLTTMLASCHALCLSAAVAEAAQGGALWRSVAVSDARTAAAMARAVAALMDAQKSRGGASR
ncbi:MAG: uroporphyrinogen-III synthase [Parvularculaceae bacterium]|nr:uroporphyrinogen-III synthase [Parvularculaceae bacterium]